MPFARASELDRLLACPGSGYLPRLDLRGDAAKKAAHWGDMVHHWVETGELPLDQRDAKALAERITLSGIDREALWPPRGRHEVALAYNVVTGRAEAKLAGTKEEREAWKAAHGDEWITGSLDYVLDLFGEPWVDDLKTGRRVTWGAYKAQQSLYGLAWGLVEYDEVRRVRSTITHWPRYPKHNPPDRFGKVLELDYFEKFVVDLRNLRDTILRGRELVAQGGVGGAETMNTVLSLGEHCGYCPSRMSCSVVEQERDPQTLGRPENE